jgi:cell division protease FtsH
MSSLLPGVSETSEATQRLVDEEVRRIVESAHADVSTLLRKHRSNLDSLVSALLENETLDEANAYAAAGLPRNQAATPEPQLTLDVASTNSAPPNGGRA